MISLDRALKAGCCIEAHSLRCYVCSSHDLYCTDEYKYPPQHLQDCPQGKHDGCSKSKTEIILFGRKIRAILRSCGKKYNNSHCKERDRIRDRLFKPGGELWQCSCDGNKCNTTSSLAVSTILLAATMAQSLYQAAMTIPE
ncbi:uncharacterized protein [Watersipora subatra]|uniref:uncharacterized protein isoform X2 n=1 Tax=Watersipora subatra TaxID=2589382 RepID=UPI00355B238F